MIIQVMYRDPFIKDFTTGPYTYKCDIRNINIGDIVIAETKFGISLAQVHKLDVKLLNPLELMQLKNVLEVCNTKYPLPKKKEE